MFTNKAIDQKLSQNHNLWYLNDERMIQDKLQAGIQREDTQQGGIQMEGTLVEGTLVGGSPAVEEGMPQEVEGIVQEDIVPEGIRGIHAQGARITLYHVHRVYPSHHPCSPSVKTYEKNCNVQIM